jgi:predicted lactoylglutathione lyase
MEQRVNIITLGVSESAGWSGFTLGYAVDSPEEVDAVCAQAAEAGASVTRAPVEKPFGYSGVFAGPDGYTWEIAHIEGLTLHSDGTVALGAPA